MLSQIHVILLQLKLFDTIHRNERRCQKKIGKQALNVKSIYLSLFLIFVGHFGKWPTDVTGTNLRWP